MRSHIPILMIAFAWLLLMGIVAAMGRVGVSAEPATSPQKACPTDGGKKADNSFCLVCHTNLEDEKLVTQHRDDGIGCIACHGASRDHADDENNITPPDVMYPLDMIDQACHKCHDTHDAPAIKVLQRWQECCPRKTEPKTIVCTDCHGKHRLDARMVRWDKRTGKLIEKKEGLTTGM